GAVCKNYVFPQSPPHGNGKTIRGQLIKSMNGDKCLEVGGWNKKNGANVNMWKCHGGKNQRWVQWAFTVLANNYVQIKSRRSGLCLDVAGSKKDNGTKVGQWSCHKGANQQWKIHGLKGGWFQLRARHSGKCLDLKGPYKKNGTPFQQWACKDVKNQSFRDAS
ncbi:unnamed protein product, partial [Laminaria digitata]